MSRPTAIFHHRFSGQPHLQRLRYPVRNRIGMARTRLCIAVAFERGRLMRLADDAALMLAPVGGSA